MITVKIEYTRNIDYGYYVTSVLINGHANSGNIDSIKCCAGVTAVVTGFASLLENAVECDIKLKKGLFSFKLKSTDVPFSRFIQSCLALMICQLKIIHNCYPSLFKKFSLVKKENNNYDKRNKNN